MKRKLFVVELIDMRDVLRGFLSLVGVSPILKRVLSIFSYAVIPIGCFILSFFYFSPRVFRQFGELAQWGIIGILFLKPIAHSIPSQFLKRLLVYRRQMGVAVFWLALFHSMGFLNTYELWSVENFFGLNNFLLYGGMAMLIIFVLGATSNDIAVRFLRKNWKRVHYFAYPALFLVLLHSSISNEEMGKVIVLGGAFLSLKILEIKAIRMDKYFPIIRQWGL